jgi:tetratricopeptide (TPR) repeat protein
MKKAVVIILLLFLIANFAYRIDWRKTEYTLIGELMYFPSGIALKALSMGFYAPLADIVWLRFVQYYGEHRLTDRKFELMYHILDILTTLDPYFSHAYTLGSLMLTHDAQRPDQAKILLKKAMISNSDDWVYPFFYGFINYVFLRDYLTAECYFKLSALKAGAPTLPKRWAAFVAYKKVGDLKTALALWVDLYNHSENIEEKAIAELYIKDITMGLHIQFLNEKVKEFTEKIGRVPYQLRELITCNIIHELPQEPHGEHYYLKEGMVYSTYTWSWKTWRDMRQRK